MKKSKELSEIIRDLRKSRNLTQQDLALNSALSVNSIILIEKGDREPRIDTLTKLAKGLGTTVQELLTQQNLTLPDHPIFDIKETPKYQKDQFLLNIKSLIKSYEKENIAESEDEIKLLKLYRQGSNTVRSTILDLTEGMISDEKKNKFSDLI